MSTKSIALKRGERASVATNAKWFPGIVKKQHAQSDNGCAVLLPPLTKESAYVPDSGARPGCLMQDFQDRFNFFLHQHTTRGMPPDVIAPPCECGIPSALRQHNNEF